MATPPLVAWMNPLPIELAPALRDRRRAVAARTTGRVLDLGGWGDHLASYRLGAEVDAVTMLDRPGDVRAGTGDHDPEGVTRLALGLDELAAGDHPEGEPGRYDAIVSLIRLPLVADLDRFLTVVDTLLADDGRLHLVEPVRRAGRLGRALVVGGRIGRAAGGLHLDRDLPAEIRARGYVVTDLERFDVPTLSAPLRPFVDAVARRPATPPRSSPS